MGIGHAGQKTGVHPHPRGKLHEPRHGRTLEVSAWRGFVYLEGNILNDQGAIGIDKITVKIGGMLFLFELDLEFSNR